jgi:Mrp family chromosome partitioning ATPase
MRDCYGWNDPPWRPHSGFSQGAPPREVLRGADKEPDIVPDMTERPRGRAIASSHRQRVSKTVSRWLHPRPASRPIAESPGLSFRYLARQIDVDLPAGDTGRAILISSPAPMALNNDACLMCAHYLASELGRRVLIVDATFGEDGVGSALGHTDVPGFVDLIYGAGERLALLVRSTARENVFVLPAGHARMTHLLPIDAARVAEFFAEAKSGYDYVVLQQGAIYAESRYLQFTRRADMVLMLVEEGATPLDDLNRCAGVFRDHQIGKIRLVLSVPR